MKPLRISLAVGVSLALALPLFAKTTTWTAGATYSNDKLAKSFNDPANWDNGVPAPGDTVVIKCSSAWNNPVYIGIENGATDTIETFDLGAEGLIFDISSSYTRLHVNFTAAGLKLKGQEVLSSEATVRIDTSAGAKIDIASGVKVQIAELFVNGSAKDPGVYTAARLPNVITGAGKLSVGHCGVLIIFR